MYGFGVAHQDRAASGLTPSSATSRTPNTQGRDGGPTVFGPFRSGPWGEAVTPERAGRLTSSEPDS